MSSIIVPSDSYIRHLSPPSLQAVPDHVRTILPDYEITHILGVGGFAKVYKAVGPSSKQVAVKIPRTDDLMATMDMEVINRFKSEAELWTRLEHPNIVALHSGSTEPLPHIAMELMEGGNLKQLMKQRRLSVSETVHIMQQVLKGLSFAHRMASVHRDLKPENILFTADGVAKISDWGIGKFMASVGKSQSVGIKGTLDYCAPEQYNKRQYGKVDWQTDIFQIGVMFYEMLTGENPFAGEDFADCMGKVLMYEPKPPSALNPDVPGKLDEIIMGALEKNKKVRWESGAVILHELRVIIGSEKGKTLRSKSVKWGIESPRLKSKEEYKFGKNVGNICPQCGNSIDRDNRKLKCKKCKIFFCQMCEEWIDKITEYKGFEISIQQSLCEDCYMKVIIKEKENIHNLIEQSKEKAMSLKKRIEERKRYCRERGFSFFKGFNRRYKEIKQLFKVKSFQKAYDESLDLISDMEIHIEKKEEKEEWGKPIKKVTRIKCPKCGDPITVMSDKRPVDIKCDSCGARGRLR